MEVEDSRHILFALPTEKPVVADLARALWDIAAARAPADRIGVGIQVDCDQCQFHFSGIGEFISRFPPLTRIRSFRCSVVYDPFRDKGFSLLAAIRENAPGSMLITAGDPVAQQEIFLETAEALIRLREKYPVSSPAQTAEPGEAQQPEQSEGSAAPNHEKLSKMSEIAAVIAAFVAIVALAVSVIVGWDAILAFFARR